MGAGRKGGSTCSQGEEMGEGRKNSKCICHPSAPTHLAPPACPLPHPKMTSLLAGVDEWQYDSFALDAATGGRPLSCLAFHLFERQGLIKTLKLDATKLAR